MSCLTEERIQEIPFIDLQAQQQTLQQPIAEALRRVCAHGHYIMGPEVFALEQALAAFCGVKHAITCSNGTDALALGLRAKGVGPGQAVLVPSFTFAATAEVVMWMGATPVFIDSLADTYNMDPDSLEQGIALARQKGLKPVGIIPVDLFGQPAEYASIETIAQQHDLWVICDGAQSFGATYQGRCVGNIGDMATTSFFPAKPLGCYGDGGAIFTNDDHIAALLKSLRVHGQGVDKYDNVRIGMNARLDTIQAAILLEKLSVFPQELQTRQTIAEHYGQALKDCVQIPVLPSDRRSAWAQYTLCLPDQVDRAALMAALKAQGVPTMIYYVHPLHRQKAYAACPTADPHGLPVCERLSQRVLSLPMSGYLRADQQDYIIDCFKKAL